MCDVTLHGQQSDAPISFVFKGEREFSYLYKFHCFFVEYSDKVLDTGGSKCRIEMFPLHCMSLSICCQ